MEAVVPLAARDLLPDRRAVAAELGITAPGRHDELLARALALAAERLAPAGLWREVTSAEFAPIYAGAGGNAPRSPLAEIHPRAERLALFAATLGAAVSERLTLLFAAREFALAAALDAAASLAAEEAAEAVTETYRARLAAEGALAPRTRLLRYSPGYCGWHLSGQAALFAALAPERIGMRLRASHLMEPLKSISGVIVAGPPEIHRFADDFPFCGECRTRACRGRGAREAADNP